MNYAQIRNMDISNGDGIGVTLYVQGCPIHCSNCFNKNLWDFSGGNRFTNVESELIHNLLAKDYITRFSILGGEPLADGNFNDVYDLVKTISGVTIWLYTGYKYDDILNSDKAKILSEIDVLVDGEYIDELKDLTLDFRGSSNQRIIKTRGEINK